MEALCVGQARQSRETLLWGNSKVKLNSRKCYMLLYMFLAMKWHISRFRTLVTTVTSMTGVRLPHWASWWASIGKIRAPWGRRMARSHSSKSPSCVCARFQQEVSIKCLGKLLCPTFTLEDLYSTNLWQNWLEYITPITLTNLDLSPKS